MTAYEKLQVQSSEHLVWLAQTAKKWREFANNISVQNDTSGLAEKTADNAYAGFSSFLIEDYVPHGCYKLPAGNSKSLAEEVRLNVEKMGEILDSRIGPADENVKARSGVMAFINSRKTEKLNDIFLDHSVRVLNKLRGSYPVTPSHPNFTRESVRDLYTSTQELRNSSWKYVHGTSAFHVDEKVNAGRELIADVNSISGSGVSPNGSANQFQEWSGKRQRGGTIEPGSPDYWPRASDKAEDPVIVPDSPASTDLGRPVGASAEPRQASPAPGSPFLRSPSVVPATPEASPKAKASDFLTPPSAQPLKRALSATPEAEPPSKRPRLDTRLAGRSSKGRDA